MRFATAATLVLIQTRVLLVFLSTLTQCFRRTLRIPGNELSLEAERCQAAIQAVQKPS